MLNNLLFLVTCLAMVSVFHGPCTAVETVKPHVVADLYGQMGNNLFQVATACAVAWDHDAEPYFPDLASLPTLYHHIFSRCKVYPPHAGNTFQWIEPGFVYHPISFRPNMRMRGYFQSEKYFAHHRKRILELFAPCSLDLKYMRKKYAWLIDHPNTVGVQIRHYFEDQNGEIFVQYGKDYLQKAMALFPESTLFVVSSNNIEFARKNMPSWAKNVVYLEKEAYYIDFYLLSFCKHNIITNSTFGWWSAWLNQNPNKMVVRPLDWIHGQPTQDVCPESWIKVNAKSGCVRDPESY